MKNPLLPPTTYVTPFVSTLKYKNKSRETKLTDRIKKKGGKMRELKFRAWDKSVEHLYEVQTIIDGGDAIGRYVLNGEMNYIHLCADEIIVEQYTGLKDKNGKKIYEGDIVRIDSMDELRVGYVELVADHYCIVCGENEEGYKIVAEFYYYSKPEENCEVIGNIHENRGLLEEEEE